MDYYSQSVGEVLREFDTSRKGLSSTEVDERRRQYGRNIVTVKTTPLWKRLIQPFASVFMVILLVAAAISFWHDSWIDGVVILFVVMVSVVMDYVQQFSTERIIRSLRKHRRSIAYTLRNGVWTDIDTTELVPGDIVEVREGDKIPADMRALEAISLRVDESQLTGESEPIEKHSSSLSVGREIYEQHNMLFQGSFVIGGSATCVVTATGNTTEFGRMAALSGEIGGKSPVTERIDALIAKIIVTVSILAVIAFTLGLARGMEPSEALRYVLALTVSVVPEGLPVAISVVLAAAMYRLAKRKVLVRSMAAVESIGVVTTIATDKTGTLTHNKLTLLEVWTPKNDHASAMISLTHSIVSGARTPDPLDTALTEYAHRHRLEHKTAVPIESFAFAHATAMSGNVFHHGSSYQLYVKASPESLIDRAHLSDTDTEKITLAVQHYAGLGYRVIALGHASIAQRPSSLESLPAGTKFEFDALLAVADSLRREAHPAILRAQAAGISVRMITGDHFETAYHIGRELGLVTSRERVFDSRDMRMMSDAKLSKVISNYSVFARVTPERKHRILTLLKKHDVTAMTGDGVNDVPALTSAHVGIAMNNGSDIAKDAGDIILLDNNFRSIVSAVHEGRTVYANIKRMVAYLVSTNLGEALVSIVSLALGYPIPLVPIQILWVNLVTDTTMVIPLGLEPSRPGIMRRRPLDPNAPLFSRFMLSRIILIALMMVWLVMTIYMVYTNKYGVDYGRTAAFSAMVAIQWATALGMRSDYEPIWKRIFTKNIAFWIGLFVSVSLQAIAVLSPLSSLLHVARISYGDLFFVTGIGFIIPVLLIELHKFVGRRYFDKG